MHDGFAIALAWPETWCKQAGAWYDYPMYLLGINRKGHYRVGHAAVVLVDDKTGNCLYFDFGRYHAPYRHGRVRSAETDHDLRIRTRATIDKGRKVIVNIKDILKELFQNPSTHGSGTIYASSTRVNLKNSLTLIDTLKAREFIPYGPFLPGGTNCSRFVSSVIRSGQPVFYQRMMLRFPLTMSPSPRWNLRALGGKMLTFGQALREDESVLTGDIIQTMTV